MKAAILHAYVPPDAPIDEQDTLEEAGFVSEALLALGYEPACVPLTLDLNAAASALKEMAPSFVFNLVEALEGKGRLIHLGGALLDHLGLSYTGAPTEALFMTSNKLVAKRALLAAGLPTKRWYTLEDLVGLPRPVEGGPFIVKSAWEHASIGLSERSIVMPADTAGLREEIEKRRPALGGNCFAEGYIEGREFNVSMLAHGTGVDVLPPAEIMFENYAPGKPKMVDYNAKWIEDSFEYENTVRTFDFPASDDALVARLREISLACWRLFGLKGYARVDFRVDTSGNPWVLEVNANPCLSTYGGFAAAAARVGLSYNDVVKRIIDGI